tara:strand:- start:90 stop:527 length:438 start_codon:yes stop_codon:yes gene_type:complete
MVTFRNSNNNRRNNFRRNDRNFKSNGDRPKYGSNFSNNDNFQRKIPGRNNHNASKLIEKYNNLAREALSSGDKILSENYFQHADHFTRILNEQEITKRARFSSNSSENKIINEDNKVKELEKNEGSQNKVVDEKSEIQTKAVTVK